MFLAHRTKSRIVVAALCPLIWVAAIWGTAARGDDAEKVENFLARLGLVDLQIVHLENSLEGEKSAPSRLKLARHLADLYAVRLIDAADDKSRHDELIERIEALVAEIPQANTTALQVMLLQADYKRAEASITRWLDDQRQTEALSQASELLSRIAPQLDRHQRDLLKQLDESLAKIDKLEDQPSNDDARAVLEKELGRLNAVAGRAAFFSGWANYYFGVSKQDPAAAREEFIAARVAFRKLLGIEEGEKYEEVDVEWLRLESINRAQAVVGLGLTEAAFGDLEASRACFALLDGPSAPPTVRDLAPYWRLRGLLNVGRISDAIPLAQQQIEKFSGGATQGKVSYCSLLVKTGYGGGEEATHDTRRLGELGLQGLARLRQFGVIGQLMVKYDIEPKEDAGFYFRWISGQQQFYNAEKTKAKDDYLAAAETLNAALNDAQSGEDVRAAGQCRTTLGWCYFRLGRMESAVEQFERAASALAGSGDDNALQSAWMTFVIYQRLSKTQGRYTRSAVEAMEAIKRDFPNSQQARKADFYIAKLQQSAVPPERAIEDWEKIKSSDPKYLTALYEICLLRHQVWSKQGIKKKAKAEAAKQLRESVNRYLAASRRDSNDQQKLRCALLLVELAQKADLPNLAEVKKVLTSAEPFLGSLPKGHASAREYHYRSLQLARQSGDEEGTVREAQWLAQNAAGTIYEAPSLVTLAKRADESVAAASASQRAEREAEALKLYARLSRLLGDSPQRLKTNKNALVASSKLAHYQYQTGQFAQSAQQLEKMVAAFGDNQVYLRRAGLAQFEAGNHRRSIEHWITLLSGLRSGTEDWYQAKYYQLACLEQIDRSQAQSLYRQFKSLYPQGKSDQWREKFQRLERLLAE